VTSVLGTPTPIPNNAGIVPVGVSATSSNPSSLTFGTYFPDGGLDNLIRMSELQDPPVLSAPFPITPRTLLSMLESLMSVAHTSNGTNHNTTQQGNVMALLGTLFRQASAANTSSTSTTNATHAPSQLDDLDTLDGITVDDENAE
jgi:hypothetical protein